MPGPPVSIGCAVLLSPGVGGPPDSGIISAVLQTHTLAGGMPVATAGSLCSMVNSVSGAPYVLPIGAPGTSVGVTAGNQGIVRLGDRIPSGPGTLLVLGPPSAPFVMDGSTP